MKCMINFCKNKSAINLFACKFCIDFIYNLNQKINFNVCQISAGSSYIISNSMKVSKLLEVTKRNITSII